MNLKEKIEQTLNIQLPKSKILSALMIGVIIGMLGFMLMGYMKQECLCKNNDQYIGLVTFHIIKPDCSLECDNNNMEYATMDEYKNNGGFKLWENKSMEINFTQQ